MADFFVFREGVFGGLGGFLCCAGGGCKGAQVGVWLGGECGESVEKGRFVVAFLSFFLFSDVLCLQRA